MPIHVYGHRHQEIKKIITCVFFYPFAHEGGLRIFVDHRGSILSNKAEISQEGESGCQLEEMSAQSSLGYDKTTSEHK